MVIYYFPIVTVYCGIKLCVADIISTLVGIAVKYNFGDGLGSFQRHRIECIHAYASCDRIEFRRIVAFLLCKDDFSSF